MSINNDFLLKLNQGKMKNENSAIILAFQNIGKSKYHLHCCLASFTAHPFNNLKDGTHLAMNSFILGKQTYP